MAVLSPTWRASARLQSILEDLHKTGKDDWFIERVKGSKHALYALHLHDGYLYTDHRREQVGNLFDDVEQAWWFSRKTLNTVMEAAPHLLWVASYDLDTNAPLELRRLAA